MDPTLPISKFGIRCRLRRGPPVGVKRVNDSDLQSLTILEIGQIANLVLLCESCHNALKSRYSDAPALDGS